MTGRGGQPIFQAYRRKSLRSELFGFLQSSLASLCEDSEQQSNFSDQGEGRFPFVEVAVMADGQDHFQSQGQFGTIHKAGSFVLAQALTLNPQTLVSFLEMALGQMRYKAIRRWYVVIVICNRFCSFFFRRS